MTAAEILAQVAADVQGAAGITDAGTLALLNAGLGEIAGDELIELPACRTSATVAATAAANYVALPTNYQKGLYWVGSANQRIRIGTRRGDYTNILTYLEKYPVQDVVGQITDVCVEGVNLLYQGQDTDTLTLRYYKKVAPLVIGTLTASPSEIPDHLHNLLLVSYCNKRWYSIIEDGLEGKKVNTDHWEAMYQMGKRDLINFCNQNKPREAKYVKDTGEY
jgi:hypothetical protein